MTKDQRRAWKVGSLCLFGQFGKLEITLFLRTKSFLYKSQSIFLYILLGRRKKLIFVDGSTTLLHFIDLVDAN